MSDLIRRSDLRIYTCAPEEQIALIPAVDAVEVRHAIWERNKLGNAVFYCSECHEGVTMYPPTQLFCYHCGARMDGRREDGLYQSLKRGLEEAIAYENGEIECRTETREDGDA